MFSKSSGPARGNGVSGSTSVSANKTPAKSSGVPSIISADLVITGNLESSGDVQVDGVVNGDITSRTLTIGESAMVKGSVSADSVRVCGSLEGELRAATVVLAKTAKVSGDLVHQSLAIEAGAVLEGNISRLDSSKANADPKVSFSKPAEGNNGSATTPTASPLSVDTKSAVG